MPEYQPGLLIGLPFHLMTFMAGFAVLLPLPYDYAIGGYLRTPHEAKRNVALDSLDITHESHSGPRNDIDGFAGLVERIEHSVAGAEQTIDGEIRLHCRRMLQDVEGLLEGSEQPPEPGPEPGPEPQPPEDQPAEVTITVAATGKVNVTVVDQTALPPPGSIRLAITFTDEPCAILRVYLGDDGARASPNFSRELKRHTSPSMQSGSVRPFAAHHCAVSVACRASIADIPNAHLTVCAGSKRGP